MKCYLIRHGITEGNKDLNFNGCRTDEPLSQEGRDAIISIEDIPGNAAVFTSPMIRARQTAEIMLPGRPAEVIENLKEMDFGKFEGKNHRQLEGDPEYQAWLDSGGAMRIPGGDSLEDFMRRTVAGLAEALAKAKAEGADCMYIVTHGGTIMSLMCLLTGESYYGFNPPNGAGYEIEAETDDAGHFVVQTAYDRFCGGLRAGPSGWRPPQYTPSGSVDG